MEYKVVTVKDGFLSSAMLDITQEVNQLLKQGWRLQGGVSISSHVEDGGYNDQYCLAQSLVREEDSFNRNNDVQVTLL